MNSFFTLKEKGAALIELALVIPVLVSIAYGASEGLIWVRYQLNVSALSRDVGRAAFDCAYNPADVQLCLDTRMQRLFENGTQGPLASADFRVSVWNFEGAGVTASLVATKTGNGLPSRFDGDDVKGFTSYSAAHGRIVVAEVAMVRNTLLPSFVGNYYSSSIF